MTRNELSLIGFLRENQATLLQQWLAELPQSRKGAAADNQRQAAEFYQLLVEKGGALDDAASTTTSEEFDRFLAEFSRDRVLSGYASDETAQFIFALKRAVFRLIDTRFRDQPEEMARLIQRATDVLDALGLKTVRAYQTTREDVIQRQQQELLELSTPVVKLWEGVLALPIIGTLVSSRTQVMMESLLDRIAQSDSQIAIIDITGVPTVDTLVAQHLIKTVTAIRLMGADCIISGVRPQIAQTIVHLGVDLGAVTTKASIADALALALHRIGYAVTKRTA
jgi:rsbT co-antagonist protein RsbR